MPQVLGPWPLPPRICINWNLKSGPRARNWHSHSDLECGHLHSYTNCKPQTAFWATQIAPVGSVIFYPVIILPITRVLVLFFFFPILAILYGSLLYSQIDLTSLVSAIVYSWPCELHLSRCSSGIINYCLTAAESLAVRNETVIKTPSQSNLSPSSASSHPNSQ